MFTPILNPKSPTPTNPHVELGKILRKHDPTAIRLYDYINHVKLFLYNSTEFRWENNSYIEGNLFSYERRQILNNQISSSYAFAIINEKQSFIQQINSDISQHADKCFLFYEIVKNNKHQVFCLHFLNENQCQRLDEFINRTRTVTTGIQQAIPTNVRQQQTPIPQSGSSQQISPCLTTQQSIPIPIPNSNNSEDPTLSLKRLLNIPSQNSLDTESIISSQENPINLLPPSAFASISPSSINAECNKRHLSKQQFRNILLHLIQNNDDFLDIIHQACLTHPLQ